MTFNGARNQVAAASPVRKSAGACWLSAPVCAKTQGDLHATHWLNARLLPAELDLGRRWLCYAAAAAAERRRWQRPRRDPAIWTQAPSFCRYTPRLSGDPPERSAPPGPSTTVSAALTSTAGTRAYVWAATRTKEFRQSRICAFELKQ